jgi:hypothetical protein
MRSTCPIAPSSFQGTYVVDTTAAATINGVRDTLYVVPDRINDPVTLRFDTDENREIDVLIFDYNRDVSCPLYRVQV